jgi:uncharacterized protein
MKKILAALREIEKKKNIKILYACETGSRAWGFPSPDSDFDIRFIYRHSKDWYLSLGSRKDTVEYPVETDFDITGWDLKKSLMLLKKSNAALIERFQSPIEYFCDDDFKSQFKRLIDVYYSPTAVFYHHYSLAKKFWDEISGKRECRLKSYFYLLRSLLSCYWIVQQSNVVPMDMEGLMTLIEEKKRQELRELIALKARVDEKYMHFRERSLDSWIIELWNLLASAKDRLKRNSTDYSGLNEFFLKTLHNESDYRLGEE